MHKNFHNLILGVSVLPALLVMPAFAGVPNTEGIAWLFGDVSIANAPVSQATFGGRRMEWNGNKYKNDLPRYQLVGRSLEVSDSDVYVGPVTLTLRELTDSDALAYNYQKEVDSEQPGNEDIDLAKAANITWADYDPEEVWNPYDPTSDMYTSSIYTKVSEVIGQSDAVYTAPGVHLFATRDSSKDASSMTFDNTTAKVNGSTINADNVTIKNGSVLTFVNETELTLPDFDGGDIDSTGLTTLNVKNLTVDGANFVVNGATENNPAASLTINADNATFKNGNAVRGGAINSSGVVNVKNATFKNNNSSYMGGALNAQAGSIIVDNSKFDTNHGGTYGGAIASVFNTVNKIDIKKSQFVGNDALLGGAIAAYQTLIVDDSSFIGNHTTGIDDGGGAIVLGGHGKATITKTIFDGNTANLGGAIATRPRGTNALGDSDIADNKDGHWMSIKNSTFKNNIADAGTEANGTQHKYGEKILMNGDGGAIWHGFEGSVVNEVVHNNEIVGSQFLNNEAKNNAGAIYNEGNLNIASVVFKENIAAVKGGAIYNNVAGVMNLSGANTFSGNKAGSVANDIHNLGIINISGGTTTLDGGITGDGTLTIAKNATLNIGKATITQGTINLGGTLIAELVDGGDPIFTAETFSNVENTGKLSLAIEREGTYNLFGNAKFDKAQEQVTSTIFDLDWSTNDAKTVIATKKSVDDIAFDTGVSKDAAATVSVIADSAAVDGATKQMKDLSLKLQEQLAKGNTDAVEHATKAIHPETESVAQSVSSSVQNTVVNLAASRMSAPSAGRNGGDAKLTSGGVWAQGLFNKSKHSDTFNGYTRGIALGLDGTINKHWTIGAGYSYAHSDINGTARTTEIDSDTVFVYGQYKPSQWYLNAIANYTMSDYSEKGTVIDNTPIFGDYSVDSFGGALATGYDFKNGITPELGLRYMHVNANDYANSYGIKTHMDASDFLTGVAGARYAFNIVATKHTTFMPQLNAGVKYDLLSDKQVATVAMPGVNAYTLDGNRLNRVGGEFGIGLGIKHGNLEISANYDIDVRKDYTSQTGMLKLRANF